VRTVLATLLLLLHLSLTALGVLRGGAPEKGEPAGVHGRATDSGPHRGRERPYAKFARSTDVRAPEAVARGPRIRDAAETPVPPPPVPETAVRLLSELTKPAYLKVRLLANPQNHRSPPL